MGRDRHSGRDYSDLVAPKASTGGGFCPEFDAIEEVCAGRNEPSCKLGPALFGAFCLRNHRQADANWLRIMFERWHAAVVLFLQSGTTVMELSPAEDRPEKLRQSGALFMA